MKTIKSEKTRNMLHEEYGGRVYIVTFSETEKAAVSKMILQVEADARERAFCESCCIPECPREWKEGDYCIACQNAPAEYLKHYDDGKI